MPTRMSSTGSAGGGGVLSPLFHGRVRLLVLAHLARHGPTPFTALRSLLGLTDGTLSVHLARLEAGGVVELERRFVGKRPQTVVKLTRRGRARFRAYVAELRELLAGLD